MSAAVPPAPAAVFVGDDDDDDKHPLIMHTCLCPSLGEGRVNEVNGGEVLLRRCRCCCKTNWQQDANATAATSPQNVAETSPPRVSIFLHPFTGEEARSAGGGAAPPPPPLM